MQKKYSTSQIIVTCMIFTLIMTGIVSHRTWLWAFNKNQSVARERLTLYSGTASSALNQFRYLPAFLAISNRITGLFENKFGTEEVNKYLATLKQESGADVLYVLNRAGLTIASSNWKEPLSFVGQNYDFRPYFQDAMKGRKGEFFAIGHTTGIPGYFLSAPIISRGEIVGVTVVKVNLDSLQKSWRDGGEIVLVTDEYGVIVLATFENWVYKTLGEVPPEALQKIRLEKRYRGRQLKQLTTSSMLMRKDEPIQIGKQEFYFDSKPLKILNWHLHYVSPAEDINKHIWTAAILTSICGALIMLLLLLLKQRRLQELSKSQAEEARRFKEINETLAQEIEERKRAKEELTSLQEELIQAGKLTALGQMAAAMAHELNQPITAMKMSMFNARKILQSNREQDVLPVFLEIEGLTDRMRRITEQLKAFARKSPLSLSQFDVRHVIDESINLVSPQLKTNDCTTEVTHCKEPLIVNADTGRLEQVIVNLIRNAIDAMREQPRRILSVTTTQSKGDVIIYIQDTGKGIPDSELEHIFEPFYTTKSAGKGIGLGLAISKRIIEGFEGKLSVKKSANYGACFEIILPAPETDETTKPREFQKVEHDKTTDLPN